MFRQTLLAKHGKLIFIPPRELSSSVTDLAAYLQQELAAVAEGSLLPTAAEHDGSAGHVQAHPAYLVTRGI